MRFVNYYTYSSLSIFKYCFESYTFTGAVREMLMDITYSKIKNLPSYCDFLDKFSIFYADAQMNFEDDRVRVELNDNYSFYMPSARPSNVDSRFYMKLNSLKNNEYYFIMLAPFHILMNNGNVPYSFFEDFIPRFYNIKFNETLYSISGTFFNYTLFLIHFKINNN